MSQFWKNVQGMADEAPEAGYANINFGKLIVKPMVVKWTTGDDGSRKPEKSELVPGKALGEGESLELNIKVLISELNPKLEFDYERNVPVRKSGRIKTDWSEIVLPSFEKHLGKNWAEALEKQPYVAIEDEPNVAGKATATGRVYGIPKLIAVYENKAACVAARDEKFKKYDAVPAVDGEVSIPAETVKQVASLIKSVGEATALKMLQESKPFGDYDPDVLIALAKA